MNFISKLLIAIISVTPLSVLRVFGGVVGSVFWMQKSKVAQVSLKNIQMCWPELDSKQQASLAKASTQEAVISGLELFKVWSVEPDKILDNVVSIEGESLYQAALDSGQGVMLLSPHIGNWEVLGLHVASQAKVSFMYAPIKNPVVDTLVKLSRERMGASLVPTDISGVKKILKALKRGEQVGILPDQRADEGSGVYSPFFGQTAYTMTLVNALHKRTKATIIIAYGLRVKGGWKLCFDAPDPMIYSDDLQESIDGLNKSVEQCVRTAPSQYQWEYKRFSKQLDNSNPYDELK